LLDDEYFVAGDNRPASFDSRIWGPIKKSDIIGRPFLRLYRFDAINFLPGVEKKK
jgi:signal peptidase I